MKNIDNETKELILSFTAESMDLLDDAESKIHNLESGDNKEVVNTIFRAFHTIKGTAGYLNFKRINDITHTAETLLDIFRKEENIKPTQIDIDIIYLACDTLRKLVDHAEKEFSDEGFNEETQIVVDSIVQLINTYKDGKPVEVDKVKKTTEKKSKKDKSEDLVDQEIFDKFIAESSDLLENTENDLLKLEKNPADKELISSIFRNIHTLKGNSGFIGADNIEEECIKLEEIFEKLRNDEKYVNSSVISFVLEQIDLISKRLSSLKLKPDSKNEQEEYDEDDDYKPLGEILVDMGAVSNDAVDKALSMQQSMLGEILVDSGDVKEGDLRKALEKQGVLGGDANMGNLAAKRKDVRISTEKLDKLFELTGELVTAEAMVINNPIIKDLNSPDFEKSVNYLSKITRDLQEIAMTIRMIPLEGIFTKSIRLVRDLSRKANKIVNLKITGEDTEMDRKIIEELSDPLTHLIRNAIDHGIEDKKDREGSGKDKIATIHLSGKYEGNEIWITVKDDGKGLDRKKILSKAKERGLLVDDGSNLKDEDVWQFIFMPGFSTAEKVTDISGRGVGMDVVKKNIEKIKGKISIHSTKGNGTSIVLKIPLTVAIIDVITVKVSESVYSIPTVDIIEFFQPKESQITKIDSKEEIIKLRDEVIPIIKFYDFFKIKTEKTNLMDGIMVVVQREDKKAALFIEEIIGNQQVVIKTLTESFGHTRGVSGCSILGNGDVSLIVDTGNLIEECLA